MVNNNYMLIYYISMTESVDGKKKKKKVKLSEDPELRKRMKDKRNNKPDWRIYGVRKEEDFKKIDRDLPRPLQTMLEKGGGCVMISSPPGSGKSNLISNILLREELMRDLFVGGLYIISPTIENDLTSKHLKEYADFTSTDYSEELVEQIFNNIMEQDNDDRELSCLLLDDCLGHIKQNSFMNRWASTVRHLRNLCIFSLQALKGLPPTVRSNVSHSIIFYQPSTKQLNDIIELHSNMGGEKVFRQLYEEATAEKYGFLLCDWRDMKAYKWGANLPEPIEIWSRYDDDGKVNKKENLQQDKLTSEEN